MYKHILVSTDGSELATKGVDAAIALASSLQAALTVVTVTEPWQDIMPGDPSALALSCELRDEYRRTAEVRARGILEAASGRAAAAGVEAAAVHVDNRLPAEGILETAAARGVDLIVMASHGRRGLGQLLVGSQTRVVVTHSALPVLVIR